MWSEQFQDGDGMKLRRWDVKWLVVREGMLSKSNESKFQKTTPFRKFFFTSPHHSRIRTTQNKIPSLAAKESTTHTHIHFLRYDGNSSRQEEENS
jgi:hypothetical protein